MYTESAFRREELEGSGGEKQPEEGMESAEILRNICEKDVTLFRTAHSKDLNSVSWALRTLVEREPETFFRYLESDSESQMIGLLFKTRLENDCLLTDHEEPFKNSCRIRVKVQGVVVRTQLELNSS